ANNIIMLEFDESGINKVSLTDFMFGREYFWVQNFENELYHYGPNVFNSIEERVNRAIEIYEKNNLVYNISKYNCEYFTRKCVFKYEALWESSQSSDIVKNWDTLLSKTVVMTLFSIVSKFKNLNTFEKKLNPTNNKYKFCKDCHNINNVNQY